MTVDPKRTIAELKELRALTADENGAQRIAWTDMWLKAREWFTAKLAGLPVEHHYDAAGNHWITLAGESKKSLILGSHLDSVPNGGWLDGCLGMMTALETLRGFAQAHNGRPPVTIRIVDWADEEGARFGRSLLGSSAFAGTHTIDADRGRADKDGIRLEDALRRCGVEIDRFPEAGREKEHAAAAVPVQRDRGRIVGQPGDHLCRSKLPARDSTKRRKPHPGRNALQWISNGGNDGAVFRRIIHVPGTAPQFFHPERRIRDFLSVIVSTKSMVRGDEQAAMAHVLAKRLDRLLAGTHGELPNHYGFES